MNTVVHPLKPIFDKDSRVLILGSMPSPKSRERGFYYMHPQNRFWRVLESVFGEKIPDTNEGKTEWLLKHKIALWDVLKSCEIKSASDASIKNPTVNDFEIIFKTANIKRVFATGKKAAELYNKYSEWAKEYPIEALPSTSPANCRCGLDKLCAEYGKILFWL